MASTSARSDQVPLEATPPSRVLPPATESVVRATAPEKSAVPSELTPAVTAADAKSATPAPQEAKEEPEATKPAAPRPGGMADTSRDAMQVHKKPLQSESPLTNNFIETPTGAAKALSKVKPIASSVIPPSKDSTEPIILSRTSQSAKAQEKSKPSPHPSRSPRGTAASALKSKAAGKVKPSKPKTVASPSPVIPPSAAKKGKSSPANRSVKKASSEKSGNSRGLKAGTKRDYAQRKQGGGGRGRNGNGNRISGKGDAEIDTSDSNASSSRSRKRRKVSKALRPLAAPVQDPVLEIPEVSEKDVGKMVLSETNGGTLTGIVEKFIETDGLGVWTIRYVSGA